MFKLPVFVLTAALALSNFALGADAERGKTLHDTHCRMCHDSVAYKREAKIAKTYDEVRAQVTRWQANTSLHWSEADIDDVTSYLASTYYKIPCPNNC